MADSLAAGQQRKSELVRLHIDVAVDFLEPGHAIARGALQLERLDFAFRLVTGQAGWHVAIGAGEHLDQRGGVFHRQLGARADGKMGCMRGIA